MITTPKMAGVAGFEPTNDGVRVRFVIFLSGINMGLICGIFGFYIDILNFSPKFSPKLVPNKN